MPSPQPPPEPDAQGAEALVQRLLERLDVDQRCRLLTGQDFWTTWPEPAVGLRPVVTSDGPAGVRGTDWDDRSPSLSLPSPTCWAATWDADLVAGGARVLAEEARRQGVDVVLGPTVNTHRSPLGGRHFECFSEDPLLSSLTAVAWVSGLQRHGVAACVKHYVANDAETERFTATSVVGSRTLHEVYLAPFEAAVREAGAWSVMAGYNGALEVDDVSGAASPAPTMTENPLIAEPLLAPTGDGGWGFDGVVVSDWHALRSTVASALAGTHLAMPGPESAWADGALAAAVRDGRVPEDVLAEAVARLLRLAARVGALADGPSVHPAPDAGGRAVPATDGRAVARELSAAGSVLLENRPTVGQDAPAAAAADSGAEPGSAGPAPLLPLDPATLRRVAVLGAHASTPRVQGGGSATVFPASVVSPLEGLRAALGPDVEVVHEVGAPLPDGVAAVPAELLVTTSPEEGGLLVRWLDADGAEVGSERRAAGLLTWVGPASRPGAATSVEVTGRLRADEAGTWRLGVRTLGRVVLALDCEVVVDDDLAPDVDDPAAFLLPPERAVDRDLAVGDEVDLRVSHVVPPGPGVSVTLGVERPAPPPREARRRAAEAAAAADVAVVVVGTTERLESEGVDRTTLELPEGQDALVAEVVAANPRTVVVVQAGAPVLMPWREEVGAVLLTWFPGQEGGGALADLLLGRVEPTGRLPTTWPARQEDVPVLGTTPTDGMLRYTEGLDVGSRAWLRQQADGGAAPAYWLGHGLGWTTWELLDVQGPTTWDPEDGSGPVVRVRLENAGRRGGTELVQVYVSRPESELDRPVHVLAGWARVTAEPGGTAEVDVAVARRALEHWDPAAREWRLEPGPALLHVGTCAGDLPLRHEVRLG